MRLMRGQCVVREIDPRGGTLWTPPQKQNTHRGVVLGLGPPATDDNGVEQPWGFGVGAVVQYVWTHHERNFTVPWPDDGKPASWIPQSNVLAVIE